MSSPTSSRARATFPRISAPLRAMLAGAGGGLLSFPIGERIKELTQTDSRLVSLLELVVSAGLWSGAIGVIIGLAILVCDNARSLRGQWHRDVGKALPLLFALSFLGGVAGQIAYLGVQNSLTRGVGWALMGAGIGVGIGVLRRDFKQAARGALGGFVGGFLGGFGFDTLAQIEAMGNGPSSDGSLARGVGQVLLGALIGLLLSAVQEALKGAWLLGISTGPYEGKESALNTSKITVGRASSNDIALFRDESAPEHLGALIWNNRSWWWQGESIAVNDAPQSHVRLTSGDTLQFGTYRFRFNARSNRTASEPLRASEALQTPPAPVSKGAARGAATSATSNATFDLAPPIAATAPDPLAWAPPTPPQSPLPTPLGVSPPASLPPASLAPAPRSSTPDLLATPPVAPIVSKPRLLNIVTPSQIIRVQVASVPVGVGRSATNAVVLSDESVSSSHAQLQMMAGALHITDLGSTNGTFVSGSPLSPHAPHPLQDGDRVRFGALETVIQRV